MINEFNKTRPTGNLIIFHGFVEGNYRLYWCVATTDDNKLKGMAHAKTAKTAFKRAYANLRHNYVMAEIDAQRSNTQ